MQNLEEFSSVQFIYASRPSTEYFTLEEQGF